MRLSFLVLSLDEIDASVVTELRVDETFFFKKYVTPGWESEIGIPFFFLMK